MHIPGPLRLVLQTVNRLFDGFFRIALVFAQILLTAMVLLIFVNVFMRYVLRSGITWSEEIALLLAVWFIFISFPLGMRKDLHISIHIFRNPPPWLDRLLGYLKDISALLVGYVFLRYGIILVQFTSRSIMPATELPSSLLYLVVPVASVLMIYEAVTDLLGFETNTLSEAELEERTEEEEYRG